MGRNALIEPTAESLASLEQPCRKVVLVIPLLQFSLEDDLNITDPWLHMMLWGGFVTTISQLLLTTVKVRGVNFRNFDFYQPFQFIITSPPI